MRYPEQAPSASCQDGLFPSTVRRIWRDSIPLKGGMDEDSRPARAYLRTPGSRILCTLLGAGHGCGRERVRGARALGAEDERELLLGAQSLVRRAERGTGLSEFQGAEHVALEVAVIAG